MDGDDSRPVEERDIFDAVTRVTESGALGASPRLRALLRHVASEQLAGRGDKLKAYTIGTDVLGRGNDFDPSTDSIVRVEFHRLRQALEHYYATAGANDIIKIRIPSGSYQPVFERQEAPADKSPAGQQQPVSAPVWLQRRWQLAAGLLAAALVLVSIAAAALWRPLFQPISDADIHRRITIAVLPANYDPRDDALASFANGLRSEVLTAMSRVKAFKVVNNNAAEASGQGNEDGVKFALHLAVQRDSDHIRLNANIFDGANTSVWGLTETYPQASLLKAQDFLAARLLGELRPRIYGAISNQPSRLQPPQSIWELYILATWVPGVAGNSLEREKQSEEFAKQALELDPNFGEAHAFLADQLAYLAAMDAQSDTPLRREEATMHAQRAMELAPDNPDVWLHLAVYNMYFGKLTDAASAAQRMLELDPNDIVAKLYSKIIVYSCAAAPAEAVHWMADFDGSLAPDHPLRWLTLTWVSILAINRADWVTAESAAQRAYQAFNTPDTVMRYAAALYQAGKKQEAADLIRAFSHNWPSLDLQHYAGAAISRMCGAGPGGQTLGKFYGDLAAALAGGSSPIQ